MSESDCMSFGSIGYIEMSHICNACDEDCEIAVKNGKCKLLIKDGQSEDD